MEAAIVTRRHTFVTEGGPQIQSDPEGGIPSGSLEVLGGLTKPYVSFIGTKFFRLMLWFVSIVSLAVTLSCPGTGSQKRPYLFEIIRCQAAKRSTPQCLSRSASCLRA